jgi:hypothetical protein
MNEHERDRIAAAMNAMRPDWPTKQLQTLLALPQLAERPRRDVTVALAWVACETASASPYRVLEAGPWWRAAAVEGDSRRLEHLKPEERCKTCSKSEHDCRMNPWGDHEFEPDIRRPRDVDLAPVVAELKGHTQPAKEETA